MTSLEERIARCARQNLQNGQIIFFHFGPETPPFCPKWAHFRTFTNQSWRYSKDAACYPVQEEKERIAYRCQIALILPPQNGSFLDSCNTSHGAENSCKPVHISGSCTCTDDITDSMNSHVCKAEFTKKMAIYILPLLPWNALFCPKMAHF